MTSSIDHDWLEDGEYLEAEEEQARVILDLNQEEKLWISAQYNYNFGESQTVAIVDNRATRVIDQGCQTDNDLAQEAKPSKEDMLLKAELEEKLKTL